MGDRRAEFMRVGCRLWVEVSYFCNYISDCKLDVYINSLLSVLFNILSI